MTQLSKQRFALRRLRKGGFILRLVIATVSKLASGGQLPRALQSLTLSLSWIKASIDDELSNIDSCVQVQVALGQSVSLGCDLAVCVSLPQRICGLRQNYINMHSQSLLCNYRCSIYMYM